MFGASPKWFIKRRSAALSRQWINSDGDRNLGVSGSWGTLTTRDDDGIIQSVVWPSCGLRLYRRHSVTRTNTYPTQVKHRCRKVIDDCSKYTAYLRLLALRTNSAVVRRSFVTKTFALKTLSFESKRFRDIPGINSYLAPSAVRNLEMFAYEPRNRVCRQEISTVTSK